jgi:hypothetical protein
MNVTPENYRLLTRRVGEVLHYIWDPIGVSDQPYARDEYDSYVPEVVRLLIADNRIQLTAYLTRTADHTIGMALKSEHTEEVIDLLFDWRGYFVDKGAIQD